MKRRYFRDSLDSFEPEQRTPSSAEHHGACRTCGEDTSRSVTVGPPGHPRNGWECAACSEAYLQAIYNRADKR